MTTDGTRPDFRRVYAGLKDFQRRTVEYVFARLYTDSDRARRFLVADEVGLGKTLVARGLIARTIEKLWDDGVQRIDVVYICSNGDIARQNVKRLKVTEADDYSLASRITLLPTQIQDLKTNRINFVSFTPGTSFDLKSSMGQMEERVLLHRLLEDAWNLKGAGPLNVLQGSAGTKRFREWVSWYRTEKAIDESLQQAFVEAVTAKSDLQVRFDVLREQFGRERKYIPDDQWEARARLIGDLRATLARTCLQALEPDLVILDEFQRFKHLLAGEDEAGQLARDLFDYSKGNEQARVLLLSATPYKMYTTSHERDDDHYADFLQTLGFLLDDTAALREFEGLVDEYRRSFYRVTHEGAGRLVELRRDLETKLRRAMVRTERLAVAEDRNGMLTEISSRRIPLEPHDADAYLAFQRVARVLEHPDIIEYWKSAPYLLNFMDEYDLKDDFKDAVGTSKDAPAIAGALAKSEAALLPFRDVQAYARIDPANARLRVLFEDTLDGGAWKLLWLPPTLPYYELGGAFAEAGIGTLTKRLVFSSWRVVPKVIATLGSYEAERRMFRSFEERPENTVEARERRKPLLRFSRDETRLTGMPLFSILYPSVFLAEECDPLTLGEGKRQPLNFVLARARERVAALLETLPALPADAAGPEDESWYWAAPVLLDLARHKGTTCNWLDREGLSSVWTGDDETGTEAPESAFAAHVEQLRALKAGKLGLGPRPADLVEVLARAAIASPAISALRALLRAVGAAHGADQNEIADGAARIAWSFVSLFNLPEVTALLRGMNTQEPYWRRVLDYCVDGCLQAVLDEYAHVLCESLGLLDRREGAAAEIAEAVAHSLTLRTAVLAVDDVTVDAEQKTVTLDKKRMRARFAARFGEEDAEGGGSERTRADQVRAAFNSPFWPFVLASTSIGQEGLDFHLYCHAIVHWNLPSNPVDLEQREGRVHRFKGHAVRKNLALRHGAAVLASRASDPWAALFEAGRAERSDTDLVPFWVYPVPGGAQIERHVPALPLSADHHQLTVLRRALVLYRMVFGQARQEDLIHYLQSHVPADQLAQLVADLRIDLSPPTHGNVRKPA